MFGFWRNNKSPRRGTAEETELVWVAGKEIATGSTLKVGRAQPSKQREGLIYVDCDLCMVPCMLQRANCEVTLLQGTGWTEWQEA